MVELPCLEPHLWITGGFDAEVAAVAEKLVPITVALWNKVQARLLPTPAKFHYLFNMRELSKVLLMAHCQQTWTIATNTFESRPLDRHSCCLLYELVASILL
jgi:hypothetical protein